LDEAFPEVPFTELTDEALLELAMLVGLCDLCLLVSGRTAVIKRLGASYLEQPWKDPEWNWQEPDEGPARRYRDAMRSLIKEPDLPHLTLGAPSDEVMAAINEQAEIFSLKTSLAYTGAGKKALVYRDMDPRSLVARNVVDTPLVLDNRIPHHEDLVPLVIEEYLSRVSNPSTPSRPVYLANLVERNIKRLLNSFSDLPWVTLTISGGCVKLEKVSSWASTENESSTDEEDLRVALEALRAFSKNTEENEIVLGPLTLENRKAVYVEAGRRRVSAVGEAGVEQSRIVRVIRMGIPRVATSEYVWNVITRRAGGALIEERPGASYFVE